MNERYILYAKAHRKSPREILTLDTKKHLGGCMAGYILWISTAKISFKKDHPEAFHGNRIWDQEKFTKYLQGQNNDK